MFSPWSKGQAVAGWAQPGLSAQGLDGLNTVTYASRISTRRWKQRGFRRCKLKRQLDGLPAGLILG